MNLTLYTEKLGKEKRHLNIITLGPNWLTYYGIVWLEESRENNRF